MMEEGRYFRLLRNILNDLGLDINSKSVILDFGCGEGRRVYELRKMGLNVFGVDIENRYEKIKNMGIEEGIIKEFEEVFRTIDTSNYKIPFGDNTFDFVFSEQVLEHVQNWMEAITEIKRVLKPGGFSLHFFPSRLRPIESHVFVPFASVFRGYAYLALWAFLGIRNSYQGQLSWKEVANTNFEYLRTRTNYLSKMEIRKQVSAQFGGVSFVENFFIKHSYGRSRYLYILTRIFPFIPSLFSTFHRRVILFQKSGVAVQG
jgi:SAM-dependent methyltransferase